MTPTDVAIIGAGPAGLFQVFELGLLGIRAHVLDSMQAIGGQCVELYADKPIYDIPAIPACSALELIERLQKQIQPFSPKFTLGAAVFRVSRLDNGHFSVSTESGTVIDSRAVVLAAGLGAFLPRKLDLPEAAALEGKFVHYKLPDSRVLDGKDVIVAGGGDAALDWALGLVDRARSVILVHHSEDFRAAPARVEHMRQLCDAGRMQFVESEIAGLEIEAGRLKTVRLRARSGVVRRLAIDHLVVSWGLHPALGPIANWGLEIERSQIVVDPATQATSIPGIFAIGDICGYPGKKKLILSGFHEGALSAFAVYSYLNANKKAHLQYTTTSPLLQQRLGVSVSTNKSGSEDDTRHGRNSEQDSAIDVEKVSLAQ